MQTVESGSCGRFCNFHLAWTITLPTQLSSENCVGNGAIIGQPFVACLKNTILTVVLACFRHEHKRGAVFQVYDFQFA